MAKYRKKSTLIDAIQLIEGNIKKLIKFTNGKLRYNAWIGLVLETPGGDMLVNKKDWIIKDIKGNFSPCKPNKFKKTYEKV